LRNKRDTAQHANEYFRNIPKGTSPIADEIDGADPTAPVAEDGAEALLDILSALEVIYPQNVTVFSTEEGSFGDPDGNDGFYDNFLEAIDGSYCDKSSGNYPR
jgi:tripeptidyl-peptidase-1